MIRRGVIWILVPRRIRLRVEDLAFSWAMTSESYGGFGGFGSTSRLSECGVHDSERQVIWQGFERRVIFSLQTKTRG